MGVAFEGRPELEPIRQAFAAQAQGLAQVRLPPLPGFRF